jgi:hypothetical protein
MNQGGQTEGYSFEQTNPILLRPIRGYQVKNNEIEATKQSMKLQNEPNSNPKVSFRTSLSSLRQGIRNPVLSKQNQFLAFSIENQGLPKKQTHLGMPSHEKRNEPCAKRSWCNSAGITLPGQR